MEVPEKVATGSVAVGSSQKSCFLAEFTPMYILVADVDILVGVDNLFDDFDGGGVAATVTDAGVDPLSVERKGITFPLKGKIRSAGAAD